MRNIDKNISFAHLVRLILEYDGDFSSATEEKTVPVHFENMSLHFYFFF